MIELGTFWMLGGLQNLAPHNTRQCPQHFYFSNYKTLGLAYRNFWERELKAKKLLNFWLP
jgi:hypothetical protein